MNSLSITRIAVTTLVRVADEVVEPNTGFSAFTVGRHLARQVDTCVQQSGLGYYPPADYFRSQGHGVDLALLALVDELAAFCAAYSRRELRRRLSRVFSAIQINHISATSYTMPRVRLRQSDRLEGLARHYAPNELRVEMQLSSIEKERYYGIEVMAQQRVDRWAAPAFESLSVIACQRMS